MHTEGGTRGKCHQGSQRGSIYVGSELQLDSSQDRDLGLQNLAGRGVHGWEDTVANCAGGSPRGHAAKRDGWWLTRLQRGAGEGWFVCEEGVKV